MRRFKNILVGVDLSQGDWFVSSELPAPSAEVVERALWLAKINSARLTFMYSLDVSEAARRMIEESGEEETVVAEANDVLNCLVARAATEGVTADMDVRFGKSWLQMIQRVLEASHDLVVAGAWHHGAFTSLLMGSTGIKLLRKCPCPVWITQPQPESQIKSVLVAHCLCAVGDIAMELGCSMAELQGAELHVLHTMEFPELNYAQLASVSAEKVAQYRSLAEQLIDTQLSQYQFAHSPQVYIVTEPPDCAVLKHVQQHNIQLTVLGTVARIGITGLISGNTAENILPQIPCSVLAVKPPDFVSPVSI